MDFGDAIKALKNGHRVKREDWSGFWCLPNYKPLNKMIVTALKDKDSYAPASPCMDDMLADDWIDLDENDEKSKSKPIA